VELRDSFCLPVPVDRLWEVLTDVELIAPCVPGFRLEEADDPAYRGAMTVKVGAITVPYDTTITFVERDEAARRAVLDVACKERRGGGRAKATVTATLSGDAENATAAMVTDVEVTGRVAQFGRGIIGDVAAHLTRQFVANLDARVLSERGAEPGPGATAEPARPTAPPGEHQALDLGASAAVPVVKRAVPILVVLLLGLVLLRRRSGPGRRG
jgi:uncharacterized protein